jgi:hypothetical protein
LAEVTNYWKDRRAILADKELLRDRGVALKTKLFKFALSGLILPSLVIGLLYSCFAAVYSLPPPQIDRAINTEKTLQRSLDDAVKDDKMQEDSADPDWARGMSTEQIEEEVKRNTQGLEELNAKKTRTLDEKSQFDVLSKRSLELDTVLW